MQVLCVNNYHIFKYSHSPVICFEVLQFNVYYVALSTFFQFTIFIIFFTAFDLRRLSDGHEAIDF